MLLVDKQGQVALQLRDNKPGVGWADCWGLFGGLAHAGETPEETLAREMDEELEIELERAKLRRLKTVFTPTAIRSTVFLYPLDGEMEGAVLHEGQRYVFVGRQDIQDGSFQGKKIVTYHRAFIEDYWQEIDQEGA